MGHDFLSSKLEVVIWNKENNALQLNTANITEILESAVEETEDASLPVGIITVLGKSSGGLKRFWMNLLLHYYEANGLGWLDAAAEDDEQTQLNSIVTNDAGGMYLWPEPFVTEGDEKNSKVLVWLVYVEMGKGESSNAAVELLGALMSSRVIEIVEEGEMPLFFQLAEFHTTYGGGLYNHFCSSFNCIIRKTVNGESDSGHLEYVMNISKREEAENTLLSSSTLRGKLPDTFRIGIAMISGTHVGHTLESMQSSILLIAYVITHNKGLFPKNLVSTSEPLTLHSFGEYMQTWVTTVNEYLGTCKLAIAIRTDSAERPSTQESPAPPCSSQILELDLHTEKTIVTVSTVAEVGVQTEPILEQYCQACKNIFKSTVVSEEPTVRYYTEDTVPMDVELTVPQSMEGKSSPVVGNGILAFTCNDPHPPDIYNFPEQQSTKVDSVVTTEFYNNENPPTLQPPPIPSRIKNSPKQIRSIASFPVELQRNLEKWINTKMVTENVEEILQVYEATKEKYAGDKNPYHAAAAETIQKYENVVQNIGQKVQQFCIQLKYKYDNLVCFAEKRERDQLEKFFMVEYENLGMQNQNCWASELEKFHNEVVHKACTKLEEVFRLENDEILKHEQKLAKRVNENLVQTYRKKMQLYISSDPWAQSNLSHYHHNLVKYCLYVFGQCLDYSGKVNGVICSAVEELERNLGMAFQQIEQQQQQQKIALAKTIHTSSQAPCYQYQQQMQQPKTWNGQKKERCPLVLYFAEKLVYTTIGEVVKGRSMLVQYNYHVSYGSLSKLVESTSENELPYYQEQTFVEMMKTFKGEAMAKLGWKECADYNLIFIIIPDWFSWELRNSFENAVKKAVWSAQCTFSTESEVAAINRFDIYRNTTANVNSNKRLVIVISESANYLHVSCFERNNESSAISSKDPVRLVATAAGNFEKTGKGQDKGFKGTVKKAWRWCVFSSKDQHQSREKMIGVIQMLWNTAFSQLDRQGLLYKKEVLLLFQSPDWSNACQQFLKSVHIYSPIHYWPTNLISEANVLIALVCNGELMRDLVVDATVETGEDVTATDQAKYDATNVGGGRNLTALTHQCSSPSPSRHFQHSHLENINYSYTSQSEAESHVVDMQHASSSPYRRNELKHDEDDDEQLVKRKYKLLEKCLLMKQQINGGSVTFGMDILKEKTLEEIVKAENVAKEENVSKHQIYEEEKHLNELVEMYKFKLNAML